MPSSKNCNWGGLINISSIVSFRPPRHFFLHFFWHFFVIIVIMWQINKYKYKYKYIFQRPFLRGLFLEGPILGKAYVWREICVIKSAGLVCSGNEIYHFCFVLLCTQGQILSTSPPQGLYSEGWFNGGFFALWFWGAYIWRGLFSEFYGTILTEKVPLSSTFFWQNMVLSLSHTLFRTLHDPFLTADKAL